MRYPELGAEALLFCGNYPRPKGRGNKLSKKIVLVESNFFETEFCTNRRMLEESLGRNY